MRCLTTGFFVLRRTGKPRIPYLNQKVSTGIATPNLALSITIKAMQLLKI